MEKAFTPQELICEESLFQIPVMSAHSELHYRCMDFLMSSDQEMLRICDSRLQNEEDKI